MTDAASPEHPHPPYKVRDTWSTCVRAWLVAWLLVSALIALFLAAILATTAIRSGPAADPGRPIVGAMHGFETTLVIVVAALHGIAVALALLVALPLQALALRLRRAGASAESLAGVAALTSLSAVLSFLVLYALNQPLVLLVAPSAEILAAILVAVYLVHAGILLLAKRRMAARAIAGR